MTRINSAIAPFFLTDEHLIAESREIKRICDNYYKRSLMTDGFKNLPNKFTLGTGHVLFFVDKGGFTLSRYKDILNECKKRNFNVTDYSDNWKVYGSNLKDYATTEEEKMLLINRISDRIMNSNKKNWHFYGEKISKEEAINLLKK